MASLGVQIGKKKEASCFLLCSIFMLSSPVMLYHFKRPSECRSPWNKQGRLLTHSSLGDSLYSTHRALLGKDFLPATKPDTRLSPQWRKSLMSQLQDIE